MIILIKNLLKKYLSKYFGKIFFKMVFLIFFSSYFVVIIAKIVNSSPQYKDSKTKNNQKEQNLDKFVEGIAKIIDGDSLYVDDNEIRLLDLDAPEYSQECFDDKNNPYSCGIVSANFLRDLAQNKVIICQYLQKDVYNRLLARCFLNEESINQKIIANGMAVIYDYSKVDQDIIDLENKARVNKLGVWQGYFQLPKDYRRSKK